MVPMINRVTKSIFQRVFNVTSQGIVKALQRATFGTKYSRIDQVKFVEV